MTKEILKERKINLTSVIRLGLFQPGKNKGKRGKKYIDCGEGVAVISYNLPSPDASLHFMSNVRSGRFADSIFVQPPLIGDTQLVSGTNNHEK